MSPAIMQECRADACMPLDRFCEESTFTLALVHSAVWLPVTALAVVVGLATVAFQAGVLVTTTTKTVTPAAAAGRRGHGDMVHHRPLLRWDRETAVLVGWAATSVLAPAFFLILHHTWLTVDVDMVHVMADLAFLHVLMTRLGEPAASWRPLEDAWFAGLSAVMLVSWASHRTGDPSSAWWASPGLFYGIQWGGVVGDVSLGLLGTRCLIDETWKVPGGGGSSGRPAPADGGRLGWMSVAAATHGLYAGLVFAEPWLGAAGRCASYVACCAGGVFAMQAALSSGGGRAPGGGQGARIF